MIIILFNQVIFIIIAYPVYQKKKRDCIFTSYMYNDFFLLIKHCSNKVTINFVVLPFLQQFLLHMTFERSRYFSYKRKSAQLNFLFRSWKKKSCGGYSWRSFKQLRYLISKQDDIRETWRLEYKIQLNQYTQEAHPILFFFFLVDV